MSQEGGVGAVLDAKVRARYRVWWLLGFANTGFLVWLPPHFLFDGPGLRSLLILVGLGLAVGAVGYLTIK